jgi:hypothetical protein
MPKDTVKAAVKKAAPRRRTTKKIELAGPSFDEIATRAYYIHLEGGADPLENWLRAERELVS